MSDEAGGGRWVFDDDHRRELESGSGVDPETAAAAGLWSESDPRELARMTGIPRKLWTEERLPALVFPYQIPDEVDPAIFRVKPKTPLAFERPDGAIDLRKYVQPKGEGIRLYFPPKLLASSRRRAARDLALVVTEGEKKTLSADSRGLLCVGLSGVSCWSQRDGRKRVLHEDWSHLALEGRRVFVAFDSDATTNLQGVRREERALCKALRAAGAIPHVVRIPEGPGGEKQGLDDYLVRHGAEAFRELCRKARPAAVPKDPAPAAPLEATACTDLGNAERFRKRHGDRFRWVEARGRWLAWDGRRWAWDYNGAALRAATETARSIYAEAAEAKDADRRAELAKHASRSESAGALRNMLTIARALEGMSVEAAELDGDPWLFNAANGTLDLRTGQIRPHKPADLLTKLSPVEYDPEAEAPAWGRFLARIFDGHPAIPAYLARALGYSMTGSTREQVLFFGHGSGANGKSTLFSVVEHVLGEYAAQCAPELLVERGKGHEPHPTEVADLQGIRFGIVTELAGGRTLAEGLVKRLTGEKTVKARFMRQDFFAFRATHTLWIGANHRPTIKGTDHAIWRRVQMVPFEVTIPPEERDPNLGLRLEDEAAGILAWLVRGCLEWQRDGLAPPPEVLDATEDYRADSDILGGWISARCRLLPTGSASRVGGGIWYTSARDLYTSYCDWCEESGEEPVTQRTFGMRLRERGLQRRRGTGGAYRWHGIITVSGNGYAKEPCQSERLNLSDPDPVTGTYAHAPNHLEREKGHYRSPEGPEGGQAPEMTEKNPSEPLAGNGSLDGSLPSGGGAERF